MEDLRGGASVCAVGIVFDDETLKLEEE